jgi:hypothetical protein
VSLRSTVSDSEGEYCLTLPQTILQRESPCTERIAPLRTLIIPLLLYFLATLTVPTPACAGEDWPPVTPEDLKMTSEPKAPGAQAIYLYRQVDRDDEEYRENHYARIKIFSDEARKYGNIEIPFIKGLGNIKNIQARTIRPDGSIVNFDGKIYENMIVKAKGVKFLAKTFTLTDVQPGSIVEYRYTRILPEDYIFDSRWLLSEELFTKRAKFSLHQHSSYGLQWSWPRGLPEGTSPPVKDHHSIRLETQNVPAFQIEDYMPPQDEMKYRVDFRYTRNEEKTPDKFWKEEAKNLYRGIGSFTDKHKPMELAVAQIVSSTDTPEQKLNKIYARCQKVRNTTFEREKTQQERDRQNLKEVQNVEDVWKRGYGDGWDITWLFLALARAAGFDASPVLVPTRDTHFFNPNAMNPADLNTNVVLVKLDGKDLYLDPGVAFAPFGLLPWSETGVTGLRVDKDGGSWVTTTLPTPDQSGAYRQATLQLNEAGSLEGKVTITYKGLSALGRRIDEHDEDDAQRRKFLEDEMKEYVPVSAEAELTNTPDWDSSAPTLVAEFNLKVPGWASSAGRRTLLPAGLFGGGERQVFKGANRVHPIYFSFQYSDVDDVTTAPPPGSQVTNLPQPLHTDLKVCSYDLTAENKGGSLHVSRTLTVNLKQVDAKYYGALRDFFQKVRNGDEQQIVLSPGATKH